MNIKNYEKMMKNYLKRKITITTATLVSLLLTGSIAFADVTQDNLSSYRTITGTAVINKDTILKDTNDDVVTMMTVDGKGASLVNYGEIRLLKRYKGEPKAIHIVNEGSATNAKGGIITTLARDSYGMEMTNDSIGTNSGTITLGGYSSYGMKTASGSAGTNEGTITVNGTDSYGMKVTSGSAGTNKGTITVNGTDSYGMEMTSGSAGTNEGTITASEASSYGMKTDSRSTGTNKGTIIVSGASSYGMDITDDSAGTNEEIITVSGAGSYGMKVTSGSKGTNKGTITVSAYNSGMDITNDSEGINEGTITVSGGSSYGMKTASGSAGTNEGSIIVSGNFTSGIFAENGSTLTNKGTITVSGAGSYGIEMTKDSTGTNSGTITVSGNSSYGMLIPSGSTGTNEGTITVSGNDSYGMEITSGSAGTNEGTITVSGNGSYGMLAFGDNDIVTNEGTITVSGNGSYGMFVSKTGGTGTNKGTIILKGKDYEIKDSDENKNIHLGIGGDGTIENHGTIEVDQKVTINNSVTKTNNDTTLKVGNLDVINNSLLTNYGTTNISDKLIIDNSRVDNNKILNTKILELKDGGIYSKNSEINITEILMSGKNNQIYVSNVGNLTTKKINLNGGTIFLDSSWADGSKLGETSYDISKGSIGRIGSFSDNEINGKLVIGKNSIVGIGSTDISWATKAFKDSNLEWGDKKEQYGAALAISSPQKLGATGAIVVDRDLFGILETITLNTATFKANSLLVLDAKQFKDEAALTGSGNSTLNVEKNAGVLLSNLTKGVDVKVVSFKTMNGAEKWNIYTDDRMIDVKDVKVSNVGKIDGKDIKIEKTEKVFEGINAKNIITKIWDDGKNNDNNPGIKFLSDSSNEITTPSKEDAIKQINSAVEIASLGGQVTSLLAIDNSTQNSIISHMNGDKDANIWVEFNYGNSKFGNIKSAGFDYSNKNEINGVTIGKDFINNLNGNLGIALSYGQGKSISKGDMYSTENDLKYYGFDVYKGFNLGAVKLLTDIKYMRNMGDITQGNRLGKITAKPNSDMCSVGIMGEYVNRNYKGFTPYLGMRYLKITSNSYDITGTNGKLFESDAKSQNMLLVPLGIKYEKSFEKENRKITPMVNLGIVASFGDTTEKTTVEIDGVNAKDTYETKVKDKIELVVGTGIKYELENATCVLEYQFKDSDHMKDHSVKVTFGYDF